MRRLQAARGTPLNRGLPALLAVGVALLGLGADQASKGAVLGALTPGRPVEVVGTLLRFNLTFNPGAEPLALLLKVDDGSHWQDATRMF